MAGDLLESLSEDKVPVRPREITRQVHDRLNPLLLILQLSEFALRALPFAFFHFVSALAGSVIFTMTGRFPKEGEDHGTRNDRN
jgi:hypothetical protein